MECFPLAKNMVLLYMSAAQNEHPLFSAEAFLAQVKESLVTINLSRPLPAYVLQKHFKTFIKKISHKCNCFIGKAYERPKLPSSQEFASIAFEMNGDANAENVRVCFKLSDLYCMGVLTGPGVLYQVGKTGESRRITDTSVFLEIGESYGELLCFGPTSKPLQLTKHHFTSAYYAFSALGTPTQNFGRVAFGIGITAMGFIEPCGQALVQDWMLGKLDKPAKHLNTEEYGKIVYKDLVWNAIHDWGDNSLAAEGLRKASNNTLVWNNDRKATLEAQKEVLIVKSNDRTPDDPRRN